MGNKYIEEYRRRQESRKKVEIVAAEQDEKRRIRRTSRILAGGVIVAGLGLMAILPMRFSAVAGDSDTVRSYLSTNVNTDIIEAESLIEGQQATVTESDVDELAKTLLSTSRIQLSATGRSMEVVAASDSETPKTELAEIMDPGDESLYYVALVGESRLEEDGTISPANYEFILGDEPVLETDGLIYDTKSGIVYIPKTGRLMADEAVPLRAVTQEISTMQKADDEDLVLAAQSEEEEVAAQGVEEPQVNSVVMAPSVTEESDIKLQAASIAPEAVPTYNVSKYRFTVSDSARTSFLHTNATGALERIEYVNGQLVVETLDANRAVISQRVIDASSYTPTGLSDSARFRWGGFFSGATYNFVVTGQTNPDEDDNLATYRIAKYSKDWTFIGAAELTAATATKMGSSHVGTRIPFDAANCALEENGNVLYVRTGHNMYRSTDGICHNANVQIVIDEATMKITDTMTYVMNHSQTLYGYTSHSFAQRLANLNGTVYGADLGDAHPRAVILKKFGIYGATGSSQVLSIAGTLGDNYTGVTLGGMSTSNTQGTIITTGATIDQGNRSSTIRNVFVGTTSGDFGSRRLSFLTSYGQNGSTIGADYVKLVKVTDDRFCVLWGEVEAKYYSYMAKNQNGNVHYVFIDGKGTPLSEIKTLTNAYLSGCDPVLYGNSIIWYAEDLSTHLPIYHAIDAYAASNGSVASVRESLEAATVSISQQTYTGRALTPPVTVQYGGITLVNGQDYTVTYSNNVNVGTATATITGIGRYAGTQQSKTFSIVLPTPEIKGPDTMSVVIDKPTSLGISVPSGAGTPTYKSSQTTIATVSDKGVVTGIKSGTVRITVSVPKTDKYASATKTISVTITKVATAITASNKSVAIGSTIAIGAKTTGDGTLTYRSSNTGVATVTTTGTVKGIKAGTATITITAAATQKSTSATKTITVTVTKKNRTITAANKSVAMGRTVSLGATVSPSATLTYQSGNTAVAKVSSTGVVTPVKVGTAKITISAAADASYNAATKVVTITVSKGAPAITAANKSVAMGKTVSLGAKVTSGASALTYKSANTAIAKVNASGVVTPVKVGTVKITISSAANTNWNAATKTVTVTVTKGAQPMAVTVKNQTVKYATLKTQAVTVAPITVSKNQGKVTYTKVSLPSGMTLASTGKITIKKGTAKKTYTAKVKVKAAGNTNYNAGEKTVTITIVVK